MSNTQKQIARLSSLCHDARRLQSALDETLSQIGKLKDKGTDLRNGLDWLAKKMAKTLRERKGLRHVSVQCHSDSTPECIFKVYVTVNTEKDFKSLFSVINRLVSESLKVKIHTEGDIYDGSTRGNLNVTYDVFLKL